MKWFTQTGGYRDGLNGISRSESTRYFPVRIFQEEGVPNNWPRRYLTTQDRHKNPDNWCNENQYEESIKQARLKGPTLP